MKTMLGLLLLIIGVLAGADAQNAGVSTNGVTYSGKVVDSAGKPLAEAAAPAAPARRMAQDLDANLGPTEVSLAIRCTNEVVKVGDEIDIEFRITNRGTKAYRYSDRTYDRSGRMDEYKLEANTETGQIVPDPRAAFRMSIGGGLSQSKVLKPGESYTKVIPLNRWSLVKTPGRYEVLGTYLGPSSARSDPITITVLPRTEEELNAYINDLTVRLDSKIAELEKITNRTRPPDSTLNNLMMKLTFTCSIKAVPGLLKGMYTESGNGGFWASEALSYYVPRLPETKKALLAAANRHGLNSTMSSLLREFEFTSEEMKPIIESALAADNETQWSAGAYLAAKYGDPALAPRLIAIALDQTSAARTTAISALFYNRTDETIKTLKVILNDPHEKNLTPLAYDILKVCRSGDRLRPDDLTAQDLKPLIGRLLSQQGGTGENTAFELIAIFGCDDDSIARIIAIAKDPDPKRFSRYQAIDVLAFNRSDDGVKVLKDLLNDQDPQIRQYTEDAVGRAYTERGKSRGKPLKMEDFDKKYQQPKPGGEKIPAPVS